MFTTKQSLKSMHSCLDSKWNFVEKKDVDINTDGFIVLNSYLIWLNN